MMALRRISWIGLAFRFDPIGAGTNLPPTDPDLKLLRATFPFVSTALTVPVTTLALAMVGALALARRRKGRMIDGDPGLPDAPHVLDLSPAPPPPKASWLRPGIDVDGAPGAFIAVQTLGPIAVLAIPWTPIFGGVKHFMPAMPYIAVAASCGLAWVTARLVAALRARETPGRVAPAAVLLSALTCVPAITETERSLPDGLSHYNMIAGGFTGGASLGMNRQFWAYCVLPMLDWVNRHDPDNRRMYWHDVLGDALPASLAKVGT